MMMLGNIHHLKVCFSLMLDEGNVRTSEGVSVAQQDSRDVLVPTGLVVVNWREVLKRRGVDGLD